MREIFDHQFSQEMLDNILVGIRQGKNQVSHSLVTETSELDDTFIDIISNNVFSLEEIVKNPKKFIVDNRIIVPVERAKRIDRSTIRTLAQNSSMVRSIDEDGNIEPLKVVTKEMEEELAIYENRFVFTLLDKLNRFVDAKYYAIKDRIEAKDITKLSIESNYKYGKMEVDTKLLVAVKAPNRNRVLLEKNYDLMSKLDIIRKRLTILRGTPFYKELAKAKPIVPPIIKTNLLKMNKDYKACYNLWLYISSYTNTGISIVINEKQLNIDNDYYDDMTEIVGESLMCMLKNDDIRESLYKKAKFRSKKRKKYKVITNIDYEPNFKRENTTPSNDLINQFYFDKIKQLLEETDKNASEGAGNIIEYQEDVKMSFTKFFKSLTKISNELYQEVLHEKPILIAKNNRLDKAYQDVKVQEDMYKRQQLLSKLKMQELDQQLSKESKELVKLEKMKFKLEQIDIKDSKRKNQKSKYTVATKQKATKITSKRAKVVTKSKAEQFRKLAKQKEKELLTIQKELERKEMLRLQREERKRLKIAEAKELKLLTEKNTTTSRKADNTKKDEDKA